jgi:fatty acid-binding protein DegV
MAIRIVTDSACDLPQEIIRKYEITVIPFYIHAGGRAYQDGVDLSRREFYERLPDYQPSPATAVPGPEIFRQTYERWASCPWRSPWYARSRWSSTGR